MIILITNREYIPNKIQELTISTVSQILLVQDKSNGKNDKKSGRSFSYRYIVLTVAFVVGISVSNLISRSLIFIVQIVHPRMV